MGGVFMDRLGVLASVGGFAVLATWFIRAQAAHRAAVASAAAKTEKAANATARAVQNSIKARR